MLEGKIVIIGAGLAGLCAARLLDKAGADFMLVEARNRIGGRILTVDEAGHPAAAGFDLGPSWYWPTIQPAIAQLVDELGLSAFCQNREGDVIFERMSREGRHRLRGLGEEQLSMRLVGGTAALVDAINRELPQDRVLLNCRVKSMELLDAGVELTMENADGSAQSMFASRVVAAVPPRLLESSISFSPELDDADRQRWRGTPTWMAPHAKFFALYDRPFWRDAGLSGTAQSMVGPMVEMHDATTADGRAGLFGFIGVGAEQRSVIGEALLTQQCLEQFVRIFGAEASRPHATLLKDWAADSLTATTADRGPSGHIMPGKESWISGPWSDRLSLAGSETSATEAGYLSGAISAAQRVVEQILAS